MEKNLKKLFTSDYDREAFEENVLIPVFQNKGKDFALYDADGEQEVELSKTEKNTAKKVVKYGEFQTHDNRKIALYEVTIADANKVKVARVGLGAIVKKLIIGNNAAFAVFKYENVADRHWRFSFIAHDSFFEEGQVKTQETNPKRYTYVFGDKDESHRTAIDRFTALAGKPQLEVKDIQEAFAVEAMSKEFFDEYRETHYANFVTYLTGEKLQKKDGKFQLVNVQKPSTFLTSVFKGDKKEARDFCKKLLGQIVFLYFIQKKGWLGATDADYKEGNGDKNFMKTFFDQAVEFGEKDIFYSEYLSKLFYETLNKERPNDNFEMPDKKIVKIPYLNGGLFEKESEDFDLLIFPIKLFTELFAFFDRFNFTIYENSPEEHTVAVDPEMLGHIFENLLEDNKDKGAFYTPKEIVQYMTQESLIEYLQTHLGKHAEIGNFIRHNNKGDENDKNNYIRKNAKKIEDLLDNVKICDPAIGSGAFPMGILQEIFKAKMSLDWTLSPARVKENIIQNSIYGVDIEKGAVDIARLRFWLSLIVDEEEPKPLPNLAYKIVVGNSLVSKFEEEVIEIDWERKNSVGEADKHIKDMQQALKNITIKQKKYFNSTNSEAKTKLKAEIRALKITALTNQLSFNKALYLNKNQKIIPMEGVDLKPKDHTNNLQIDMAVATFDKIISKLENLKKNPNKPFNHFDWRLDFPEILNPMVNENTGFDIVIGNPPYIQLQKALPGNDELKYADLYKDLKFETFERTGDIYALFYEKGIQLLTKNGALTFITSNKWMRANYGKSLRNYFSEKNPLVLLDLGPGVFENATVDSNIIQVKNNTNQQNLKAKTVTKNTNLNQLKETDFINLQNLSEDAWTILNPQEQNIKTKIEKVGTPLKDWDINIYRGVLTGYNEAFIIDGKTKDELIAKDPKNTEIIKPILRGKDIKRYQAKFADLWLIATFPALKINIDEFPAIKEYLERYLPRIKQTGETYIDENNIKQKTRKKTGNKWFEASDTIAYYAEFEKEKIVYPNMASEFVAFYDTDKIFTNQKCFIVTSETCSLKYITAFLNSKINNFYFRQIGAKLGAKGLEMSKVFVELIPIPKISKEAQQPFIDLVDKILSLKKADPQADTTSLEKEIDVLVYGLYGLTAGEVLVVEKGL